MTIVPQSVSGSERSFRMSHEIVPVPPAQMSHHIDPAEKPEAKTAQTWRKAMCRDIDPPCFKNGEELKTKPKNHHRNHARHRYDPGRSS